MFVCCVFMLLLCCVCVCVCVCVNVCCVFSCFYPLPIRSQHYLKLPIQFRPSTAGRHASLLLIKSETSESLVIQLIGEAMP